MAIKKIRIKSTVSAIHNSESSPSPYSPSPTQGVPARRLSTASHSESPVKQGQPSLSTRSSHNPGTTVDDAIPYYHHYHYPQEQEQEQEQRPHIQAKRTSQSARYPLSSIVTNNPSTKTGRRTTSRPLSVYDEKSLPPAPPSHMLDKNTSNDGASDNSQKSSSSSVSSNNNSGTASKQRAQRHDEKVEDERSRVEQIAKDYQDIEKHNRKLEDLIRREDDRFNSISRQFHHDTMEVRATDEDYSTIHNSLTILQAKIASVPLSMKPYLVDKQKVTDFFLQRWPHLGPAINHLCKRKQPDSTALDNVIISQLIEKLVTELLLKFVHQAPVHIGFPASNAYLQIVTLMDATGHQNLSLRLRQQLCKITARSTTHTDTGLRTDTIINRSVAEEKAVTIASIAEELLHFYDDPQNPTKCSDELMTRIHRIVESAAEVSLAMRSQVSPVIPLTTDFTEGKTVFDPELFTMQHGSAQDASIIQVLICPPFVFYENDQQLLTMKGKAICF